MRTEARQIVRHTRAFAGGKCRNEPNVLGVHAGAHAGGCFIELVRQVSVMLSRETRSQAPQFAHRERSVTFGAVTVIDDAATLERRAVAATTLERRPARQALGMGSDIQQFLRAIQVVLRGEVPHALVPSPVMAEVHELLDQHRDVLAGYGRDAAVTAAAPVRGVAGRTGREQVGAMLQVRFKFDRRTEFGDGRRRAVRKCSGLDLDRLGPQRKQVGTGDRGGRKTNMETRAPSHGESLRRLQPRGNIAASQSHKALTCVRVIGFDSGPPSG